MKCSKCGQEFDEKDIDESHDIPKYMGGTDADGRHYLCKQCHDKYEGEVLKLATMTLIKSSTENIKAACRSQAKIVRSYFFKKKEEQDGKPNIQ